MKNTYLFFKKEKMTRLYFYRYFLNGVTTSATVDELGDKEFELTIVQSSKTDAFHDITFANDKYAEDSEDDIMQSCNITMTKEGGVFTKTSKFILDLENDGDYKHWFNISSTLNILDRPVDISDELCDFLEIKRGTQVSRSSVNQRVSTYICVSSGNRQWVDKYNPVNRNLRDPTNPAKIIPDEKLSKMLGYDEFVEKVKRGEKTWRRRNRETGEMVDVVATDTALTYSVMQHLLAKHFVKA